MSSDPTEDGLADETRADETGAASARRGSAAAAKTIAIVVFAVIATFYLVNALLLPAPKTDEVVGPKAFPVIVAVVLLGTTLLGLLSLLRGQVDVRPVSGRELFRVLLCVLLFALFTASIFLIGFVEAAAVFAVLTTTLVFGVRMRPAAVLGLFFAGLLTGMILFLVFDIWLGVLLPVGWLEYLVFGVIGGMSL